MINQLVKENKSLSKFKFSPKFRAEISEGEINGEKVLVTKPQTFMNLSGESIRPLSDYYKIPYQNIIVVYDDVYIPFGTVRVRQKGSSGGQNGMNSIIAHLGTENFPRIRIGTGPIPEGEILYDFVLGKFSKKDFETLKNEVYLKFEEELNQICCNQ